MSRLSEALNEGLRRAKKAEKTGKQPRPVTYSGRSVDQAIAQGVANLYKMLDKYNVAIEHLNACRRYCSEGIETSSK